MRVLINMMFSYVEVMMRTRGALWSKCNNEIDKFEYTLKCGKSLNSYHIKCVNVSVEHFNDLRNNDVVRAWNCVGRVQNLNFSRPNVADGQTTTITVTNK